MDGNRSHPLPSARSLIRRISPPGCLSWPLHLRSPRWQDNGSVQKRVYSLQTSDGPLFKTEGSTHPPPTRLLTEFHREQHSLNGGGKDSAVTACCPGLLGNEVPLRVSIPFPKRTSLRKRVQRHSGSQTSAVGFVELASPKWFPMRLASRIEPCAQYPMRGGSTFR